MARETRLTSYDEPIYDESVYDEAVYDEAIYDKPVYHHPTYDDPMIRPVDLDESGSRLTSHRYPRAVAARQDFAPDDPMPLFLSDHPEIAQAPRPRKVRVMASTSSRILKLSMMTAAAAAIAFGIMSVDNPLALFANAKASLPGSSAVQPGTPSTATVRTVAVVPVLPAKAAAAPTRDEIAAALRTARQSQPEIRQPPAAAAPARRLDADELAVLLKRARSLIAVGDIAPARLLLERAADAQEAGAALLLAQTYDPAVLGTPDTRSITPDPAAARDWYQKAARFGSAEAQQRLAQMQN